MPGRWDDVRAPTENELKATSVLALAIDEASAKVRSGGPMDDEEDYALPGVGGRDPARRAPPGQSDPSRGSRRHCAASIAPPPAYATDYRRPRGSPRPRR